MPQYVRAPLMRLLFFNLTTAGSYVEHSLQPVQQMFRNAKQFAKRWCYTRGAVTKNVARWLQWRIQKFSRGAGRKTIYQLRPHLSQMRTAKYRPMPFTRKISGFLKNIWSNRRRPPPPPSPLWIRHWMAAILTDQAIVGAVRTLLLLQTSNTNIADK